MSMQRECLIFRATNNKWYITLGNREYSGLDDATTYGPFNSMEEAKGELQNHSNPGSYSLSDSGIAPVPTQLQPPTRRNW